MKFSGLIILFIFVLSTNLKAQTLIEQLEENYKTFRYNDVISLSEKIIYDSASYNSNVLIEVFTMRAVAYYSISEIDSARKSFIEILRTDRNHQLDPVKISPKILSLFNDVRNDFERIESSNTNNELKEPEENQIIISKPVLDNSLIKNSLARSIALPGLGHLYLEGNIKGWLLTTASTATLGGMIYYIFNVKEKENSYLSQTEPDIIQLRYNEYNSAYKIRNFFIAGYAVLWLYSQIDLLFFSDELFEQKFNISAAFTPGIYEGVNLNFKFSF